MLHQRIAISLSFIALLVTMPRLVLAFLIGDGILVPQHIEVVLLTATGIGSGVVLTVGNAILAHALAEKSRQKGMLWWVLLLAWVCFLLSAIVVVSPTLVSGLRKSSLITVLPSASAQWFWAITAVAVVEKAIVGAAGQAREGVDGGVGLDREVFLRRPEQLAVEDLVVRARAGRCAAIRRAATCIRPKVIWSVPPCPA